MAEKGCRTRRQVLRTGLAFTGGIAAVGATAATAQAQEKIDQKVVQYQAQPKDGQKCDQCVNWQPPNACKIVAGSISPNGWCVAFAPKES
jgi:hypothetical protein